MFEHRVEPNEMALILIFLSTHLWILFLIKILVLRLQGGDTLELKNDEWHFHVVFQAFVYIIFVFQVYEYITQGIYMMFVSFRKCLGPDTVTTPEHKKYSFKSDKLRYCLGITGWATLQFCLPSVFILHMGDMKDVCITQEVSSLILPTKVCLPLPIMFKILLRNY